MFGTDGRLKLFNPAFAEHVAARSAMLADQPHIDAIAKLCLPLCGDGDDWTALRAIVTGLAGRAARLRAPAAPHATAPILDCAAAPLPDGATLLTFTDVTAGVNVERALNERNQALIDAEKLRNDFVHHVSYELRSPLTNIIGFIQLLGDGSVGSLNAKQREYAGYVMKSSAALLAIINDILDLATIDIDAMELSLARGRYPARPWRRPPKACRTGCPTPASSCSIVAMDGIGTLPGRRQAHPADPVQPAVERDRLLRARPDRHACGAAPRR